MAPLLDPLEAETGSIGRSGHEGVNWSGTNKQYIRDF
jgi:hypothetical protein